MRQWVTFLTMSAMLLCATPAFAHPHHAPHSHATAFTASGFSAGFEHPFFGLDHLLAMVAVGLLAVMVGGLNHRRWILPGCFVGGMLLGGVAGILGVWMPGVEVLVACSVLILGVLLATGEKLPLAALPVAVALFGVAHGHAHGTELPALASPAAYAAGFVFATLTLHGLGIAVGLGANRLPSPRVALRYSGATIAVAGLWMVWHQFV